MARIPYYDRSKVSPKLGAIMDSLTSLFAKLHAPIHCLKDTKSVKDGIYWAIREIAEFTTVEEAAKAWVDAHADTWRGWLN